MSFKVFTTRLGNKNLCNFRVNTACIVTWDFIVQILHFILLIQLVITTFFYTFLEAII